MTKEEEVIFNNLFAMFRSEGWKQLVSDFTDNGNLINLAELVKDGDDLLFKKGQLNVIASVVGLEATTTAMYEQLSETEEEVDEDN